VKVNVHAVNFNVDGKLVDSVQDRMDKLRSITISSVCGYLLKSEKIGDKENKIVEVK
jgi:putative sigma-54 modulation protein